MGIKGLCRTTPLVAAGLAGSGSNDYSVTDFRTASFEILTVSQGGK